MADTAWTLGSLLDWTAKFFAQKNVESARLDAQVLLAHVVGCKRIDLYGLRHAEPASAEVQQKYRELIKKRLDGCPVAYLVGKKEFYNLEFAVGPAVLIPRPDTEHLLMEALAEAKKMTAPKIIDIGTGSGCLPVTLAKHLPKAEITAVDISPEALAFAKKNAERHGVLDRIRFLRGDLFASVPDGEKFDMVASNPPYIAAEEMADLPIGVRDYEPHLALNGGPGGFVVFDRLIDAARGLLNPGGWLIVEIGSEQEKPCRAKIEAFAEYRLGPTVFDSSGHPRVLKAKC